MGISHEQRWESRTSGLAPAVSHQRSETADSEVGRCKTGVSAAYARGSDVGMNS